MSSAWPSGVTSRNFHGAGGECTSTSSYVGGRPPEASPTSASALRRSAWRVPTMTSGNARYKCVWLTATSAGQRKPKRTTHRPTCASCSSGSDRGVQSRRCVRGPRLRDVARARGRWPPQGLVELVRAQHQRHHVVGRPESARGASRTGFSPRTFGLPGRADDTAHPARGSPSMPRHAARPSAGAGRRARRIARQAIAQRIGVPVGGAVRGEQVEEDAHVAAVLALVRSASG